MKIKKIGWTTFLLSTDSISVVTDPLMLKESGVAFPKTESDVSLFTKYDEELKDSILLDKGLDKKIVPNKRDTVMEIYTPGEYEVGGLMIRRGLKDNFYMVDEKTIRVVYMGGTENDFNPESVKNLGDVDVLILPVGDGLSFMNYEKIEKVVSNIDPAVLIPCAFKEDGNGKFDLKSKDEFLKHFGYANVREENYYTVTKKKVDEEEQRSVEIIFLK